MSFPELIAVAFLPDFAISGLLTLLAIELVVLALLLLLALFFMIRFRHVNSIKKKHAELISMRQKAYSLIEAATGEKKKDLEERKQYLETLIAKNETALKNVGKKSWLDLGGIPQGIYFSFKYLLSGLRHPLKKKKKITPQTVADVRKMDGKILELRSKISDIEDELYNKKISEQDFKKKLFEFKEKIHLLELDKKELS
ncbi:MAG: hypothetical protein QGI60_01035 [archaeon]|nr:hypothetical protein [archaeon]